jgi:hypothetical protein
VLLLLANAAAKLLLLHPDLPPLALPVAVLLLLFPPPLKVHIHPPSRQIYLTAVTHNSIFAMITP